jgi:hypothetical protein
MKNIFRSVEFWKSAVMTMPDNSFFELLRSVFGKIKTPFNKQQLLKDLEMFLLREDIQKTIAAYINENDAKIIAAAALFGEPVPAELESFFSGELSYVQVQDIIVNLEERFILYRFNEDNTTRIALNPVLEQVLSPVSADISILFPPVSQADGSSAPQALPALLNDRILAALMSFASQWESFYRSEGVMRKQVIEAGKNCFPGMDLETVFGSLQALGLFYADGDRLLPDKKRFDDFGLLSAQERGEYCCAALLVYNEIKTSANMAVYKTDGQAGILPLLYKNRIREVVNFIHGFLDSFDENLSYAEKTFKRFAEILKARTEAVININLLFEALEKTSLVVTASKNSKQLGIKIKNKEKKNDDKVITIDSDFSIIVYPEIDFSDAVNIAVFLNIKEAGAVVRFELEKDSAVRAFDKNTSADQIIELLNRLSGGKVEQTLAWNLKDWEKRHGEVSLKKGIVLTLAPEKRYLTEIAPLSGMISETLATGVYLLGENAMDEAAGALHNAGIDIISRRTNKKENAFSSYSNFPPPSSLKKVSLEKIPASDSTAVPKTESGADTLTAEFHAMLQNLPFGKVERDELSARINRRLVLCEAQLKDADIRYEKLEARHMDYTGKQIIAKQAISQQSAVEIVWPGGKEKSFFAIPKTLEKEKGDIFLAVVPAGKDEIIRIPLARISLLRRIKKSIFET